MNEFIELETLENTGEIYRASTYIDKIKNSECSPIGYGEMNRQLKYLSQEAISDTNIGIYNCSQIGKVYNVTQPKHGFEHTIYQIDFVDKTYSYISQDQYKKLREILLNKKK